MTLQPEDVIISNAPNDTFVVLDPTGKREIPHGQELPINMDGVLQWAQL